MEPQLTRVLYCTDTLMAGGTEYQLVQLITRLDPMRFARQVVCLQGEYGRISLHYAPQLEVAQVPLHVFNLGWSPAGIMRSMIRTVRLTWQIRPHILHAVNHHSNHITRLMRPFMPRSLRLITTIPIELNAKQVLYEEIEQFACDYIVCVSPYLQQKMVRTSHIPAEKLLSIPIGLDIDRFSRDPGGDFRNEIAPSADRVVVMLGRIVEQKAPHLLAQAIGLLKQRDQLPPKVRIFFVGERHSETSQAQLSEAIRRYGLEDIVSQHPQTSQPEAYYYAADVVVLATLWEGLPNVLLESLAAGRPVVISEAANKSGLIEQDITGWIVRTGDVEHLAQTLSYVLRLSREHLASMQAACQMRGREFAMPLMVERYTALYDRLRAMPKE